MTNFNIDCLDSLGNFIISQSRYRHTTPELLIAQVLEDWRKGVESGEIPSPPGIDVNKAASNPSYKFCHIHFQNKLHQYQAVLRWIEKMIHYNPFRKKPVAICALDLHYNPKVKRCKDAEGTNKIDTSDMGPDDTLIHCGDCLLKIDNDFVEDFYALCEKLGCEWGPHSVTIDGPPPEKYQHFFNKTPKELLKLYPFPDYVREQLDLPPSENADS